jgi:hypothetical protein
MARAEKKLHKLRSSGSIKKTLKRIIENHKIIKSLKTK